MFTSIINSVKSFATRAWDAFVTGLTSVRDSLFSFADKHPALTVVAAVAICAIAVFAPALLVVAFFAAIAVTVVYIISALVSEAVIRCYVAAGNSREEAVVKTTKLFNRISAVLNFIINVLKLVAMVKEVRAN